MTGKINPWGGKWTVSLDNSPQIHFPYLTQVWLEWVRSGVNRVRVGSVGLGLVLELSLGGNVWEGKYPTLLGASILICSNTEPEDCAGQCKNSIIICTMLSIATTLRGGSVLCPSTNKQVSFEMRPLFTVTVNLQYRSLFVADSVQRSSYCAASSTHMTS